MSIIEAPTEAYITNKTSAGKSSRVRRNRQPSLSSITSMDCHSTTRRPKSLLLITKLKDHITDLYQNAKTSEKLMVAYKGGHLERDLLKELNIPAVNLTGQRGIDPIPDCGHHKRSARHCAMVECQTLTLFLSFLTKQKKENWETS